MLCREVLHAYMLIWHKVLCNWSNNFAENQFNFVITHRRSMSTNQLGIYYLTKEEDGHASIVPEKVGSRTFLIVAKILVGFLGRLIHAFSLNT